MSSLRIALVGAALVTTASPAVAALITYTSQSTFDAAVGAETTFGFDEGNSDSHFHDESNPYTLSGVTFTDNVTAANVANGGSPILFLVGAAATPTYGKDFLSFQNTDGGISADLTTSGVTAFGFQYASYVAGGAATVSVNGGAPSAISVTGTPSFIGFTSTTPITNLTILFPEGYSFDLTSVSYGAALPGAVPESATWAMFIGGFGLIGAATRRRQRMTVRFA